MQTEYIASGDHYLTVAEHKILKVLLGSCVGVAIFDRAANIGGIIHLLLPEPASLGSSWSPGSYASTGLPMFINALLAAGADKARLQAVVAGGALFGGISQQDIALNIGGRCVDKVHAILQEQQIPILQEESCGFSPSVLTLDTKTWRSEITTRFEPPALSEPPDQPSSEDIREAIRAITPIPQAAVKIIHLISAEGGHDTAEIVRTIETDQVLAAKVLSLSNSAMFGARRVIDSLTEAVVILGESHLLHLVATASVDSLLNHPQNGYAMLKGGLYKHAIGVASASRIIASECGQVSAGVAYSAGLLHDIGKVVLDHYFASFRPLFYQSLDPAGNDLIQLERHLLGTSHQEVGQQLATEWGLPASIAQAIAHHHQPDQAANYLELVHLVYLADLLTSWYLAGFEFERIDSEPLQSSLAFLHLSPQQLPAFIEKVPWRALMYL